MTISSDETRTAATGNGVTTAFNGPYVLQAEDLKVYVDGELVDDADYTVGDVGNEAGTTVTFDSAPTSETNGVVIIRDPELIQPAVYPEGGSFPAATHEAEQDRGRMIDQTLAHRIARAVRAPDYESGVTVLPAAEDRAGMLLGFGASGDIDTFDPVSGSTIATQAQAIAGELNTVVMSPLRTAQALQVQNVWPARHYGIYAGMTNPGAAINALMATVAAAGGGDIILGAGTYAIEEALDNKYTGVMVRGVREDKFHDGGTNIVTGTVIAPAANTFRALRLRSPYGASNARFTGGGFYGIKVVGSYGVEVDSYSAGVMDVYLEDCAGDATTPYAAVFKCGVAGTDLAEACDIQDMDVHIYFRQLSAGAPRSYKGALLTGSSNANVNHNRMLRFVGQMYDGDFVTIESADSCDIEIRGTRSGTANALVAKGATAAHPVGAMTNRYMIVFAGPIIVQGTDTGGVTAAANGEFWLGISNGTPLPTFGTGAKDLSSCLTWEGHRLWEKHVQPVFADAYSTTDEARAVLNAADTMMAYNSASAFCWGASNGTRTYGARINGSNGRLDFQGRTSPTGYSFDLPVVMPEFTVAGLPSASAYPGAWINVSNETGGYVIAFSDGTNWRRVTDRAVVS